MIEVDITIIGAGVIGLSIAKELSLKAEHIVILEKEPRPGMGISSRNSEVIHAGLYYPAGSLKAKLCVQGSELIYEYCLTHGIPFKKTGKVIVAANHIEDSVIETLQSKGTDNGVHGLRILSKQELRKIEPNVFGSCALFSPHTGIIDSHRLVKTLEAHCLEKSVSILYRTALTKLQKASTGFHCTAKSLSGQEYTFSSRIVINAAGLFSDKVAALAGIDIDIAGYRIYPVKGEYFRVRGNKNTLISGLVYPVPEQHLTGLGIHATKDLAGSLRLGPSAFPVEKMTYEVNPSHADTFFENARHMFPFLDLSDLMPDMAGIRPKIQKPGDPAKDFIIRHEEDRGLPGMINLIGIESPGLTSCLAIGKHVADVVKEAGLIT